MSDEAVLPLEGLLAHGALVGQPVLVVQDHVPLHDEVVAQHLVADGALGRAKPLFRRGRFSGPFVPRLDDGGQRGRQHVPLCKGSGREGEGGELSAIRYTARSSIHKALCIEIAHRVAACACTSSSILKKVSLPEE